MIKGSKQYNFIVNGKELHTDLYEEVSEEEFKNARKEYYYTPTKEECYKLLLSFSKGGKSINKITAYYFKYLMSLVKFYDTKWSIKEVFDSHILVNHSQGVFNNNTKVYPPEWTLCQKLVKRFGIGGSGFAKKPTQFPISTVENILEKYNVNGKYYDFSCGWGSRLLGTMRYGDKVGGISYYGTDPNNHLVEILNELNADYNKVTGINHDVDIRCVGSEHYVSEWENMMGVAFSSPPYFNLEDYVVGEQSYKEGVTYESWKDNYVRPTIRNIYKYLVNGGYFIFNIKDVCKYPLTKDWYDIAVECGFKFVGIDDLDIVHRCSGINGECKLTSNNEQIFVFQKI